MVLEEQVHMKSLGTFLDDRASDETILKHCVGRGWSAFWKCAGPIAALTLPRRASMTLMTSHVAAAMEHGIELVAFTKSVMVLIRRTQWKMTRSFHWATLTARARRELKELSGADRARAVALAVKEYTACTKSWLERMARRRWRSWAATWRGHGGEPAKTSIRSLSGNARLHRRRRGRPQSLDSDLAAFWNSREVVSWWEILEEGEEWEANEKHWVEWVAKKGAS